MGLCKASGRNTLRKDSKRVQSHSRPNENQVNVLLWPSRARLQRHVEPPGTGHHGELPSSDDSMSTEQRRVGAGSSQEPGPGPETRRLLLSLLHLPGLSRTPRAGNAAARVEKQQHTAARLQEELEDPQPPFLELSPLAPLWKTFR